MTLARVFSLGATGSTSSPHHVRQTEYALAVTRALLTAQALVVALRLAWPRSSIDPAFAVLVVYAVFAWLMLLTLHFGPYRRTVHPVATHVIDIVAATMMTWGATDSEVPSLLLIPLCARGGRVSLGNRRRDGDGARCRPVAGR